MNRGICVMLRKSIIIYETRKKYRQYYQQHCLLPAPKIHQKKKNYHNIKHNELVKQVGTTEIGPKSGFHGNQLVTIPENARIGDCYCRISCFYQKVHSNHLCLRCRVTFSILYPRSLCSDVGQSCGTN